MDIEFILDRIKTARKEQKVTQKQIADGLGISQDVYSKLERGSIEMRVKTMFEIMKILEIDAQLLAPTQEEKDIMMKEMYHDIKDMKAKLDRFERNLLSNTDKEEKQLLEENGDNKDEQQI